MSPYRLIVHPCTIGGKRRVGRGKLKVERIKGDKLGDVLPLPDFPYLRPILFIQFLFYR